MEIVRLAETAAARLWGEYSPAADTLGDNDCCGAVTRRQCKYLTGARDSLAAGDMKKAAGNLDKIVKGDAQELVAIREELGEILQT